MKSSELSILVEKIDASLSDKPISAIALHAKLDLPLHRLDAVSRGLSMLHGAGRVNREWRSSFGIGRFYYWKGVSSEQPG